MEIHFFKWGLEEIKSGDCELEPCEPIEITRENIVEVLVEFYNSMPSKWKSGTIININFEI